MHCQVGLCETKFEPKRVNQKYCSHKCRIRAWNSRHAGVCKHCGVALKKKDAQTCKGCVRIDDQERLKRTTLDDYLRDHPHQRKDKYSGIRLLAKSWNPGIEKGSCPNCEYDKHLEVAHIKPISSFPGSATLGEINNRQNLIGLCRNCHWEMENDLLTLPL